MNAAEFRAFVAAHPWTFVKTMPQNPHEYIVRKNVPDADFVAAVVFIREHGHRQVFQGRPYTQYETGGHTYWSMGAPVDQTIILNRKVLAHHHSALTPATEAAPLDRFSFKDSLAFVHDIMAAPFPTDFDVCDLLYGELPWGPGLAEFDLRAGVTEPRSYRMFMGAVARVVLDASPRPRVLLTGAQGQRLLPTSDQVVTLKLNGRDCLALLYNVQDVEGIETDMQLLRLLARRYRRVGDFLCGYGRSGRVFLEAGKSFVMSDYNPKCIGYIAANAARWVGA